MLSSSVNYVIEYHKQLESIEKRVGIYKVYDQGTLYGNMPLFTFCKENFYTTINCSNPGCAHLQYIFPFC